MLRKLVLAVSFSTLAAFSGSVLAAAFDVTDIEGRKVHFEDQPKTFVVANYIANFMMVGGAPGLENFLQQNIRLPAQQHMQMLTV